MNRTTARVLASAAAIVMAAAGGPGSQAAYAIDHGKGRPGFCPSATGVTVVVDFQQLGGTTIVRCHPGSAPGTGLDALKGAGFQISGVQRWGEGFICRIENRPSAAEQIPIDGNENYRERCIDTPPAQGYWSYWHAGNNCPWAYSQWGVKNRTFVPGGFEGWSFSLNATADTNPVPRIAPVRPGTEGGPCTTTVEPAPTGNDPDEQQPAPGLPTARPGGDPPPPADDDPGGGPGTGPAGTGSPSPGGDALPLPRPRGSADAAAPDPTGNVEFTGGEAAADVNTVIREQSGASRYAPWAAGAVVVLLLTATGVTARRRARSSRW